MGCTQQAQIVRGNTEREVYVNNFSGSVGDAFQLTPQLNVNYGIRYDYLGPMHNATKDLSVFRPDNPSAVNGLVFQGAQVDTLWPKTTYDFSPRFGFAYQPPVSGMVVRGGFGMFFDQPNMNPFLDNRPPNGGASGAESNPGGPAPVSTVSATNIVITPGKLLFSTAATYDPRTNYNLFSVSPTLRPAYTFNFNLNVEKTLNSRAIFMLGYVGSQSRKLLSNHDINQAGEGEDRVDMVSGTSPYAGSKHAIVGGQVQWITPGAFANPSTPSFGGMRRNQLTAPGYGDVDLSVFKNTKFEVLGHDINAQLRAEMFNLFNRANYAPPVNSLSDGAFGTITQTIGYYNGAPGIGPGEPFNTQFALKILF